MAVVARILEGIHTLLSILCVLVAVQYWRALAFPKWLPALPVRLPVSQVFRGVFFGLVMLAALLLAQMKLGSDSVLAKTVPYVLLIAGGYLGGRFGRAYGIAAILWTVLAIIFFIPLAVPLIVVLSAGNPETGHETLQIILPTWWEIIVPLAPMALALALAAALLGSWHQADHGRKEA